MEQQVVACKQILLNYPENIVLVGMPGSGKTTMGKALAKHLSKTFMDSDEEIQHRTGVTIPHIFDVEGEVGFRQRETAAIRDLLLVPDIVLATGGGAVLMAENRELFKQHGIVVYLNANVYDLWHRTKHDRSRPLLRTADPKAKLMELHGVRHPLYLEVADIVVNTGRQSVNALMLHLLTEIEAYIQQNPVNKTSI